MFLPVTFAIVCSRSCMQEIRVHFLVEVVVVVFCNGDLLYRMKSVLFVRVYSGDTAADLSRKTPLILFPFRGHGHARVCQGSHMRGSAPHNPLQGLDMQLCRGDLRQGTPRCVKVLGQLYKQS